MISFDKLLHEDAYENSGKLYQYIVGYGGEYLLYV